MALKINEEIIDFINDFEVNNIEDEEEVEEIKKILIEALELEFKRYKEDIGLYSDEYDEILKKYLR